MYIAPASNCFPVMFQQQPLQQQQAQQPQQQAQQFQQQATQQQMMMYNNSLDYHVNSCHLTSPSIINNKKRVSFSPNVMTFSSPPLSPPCEKEEQEDEESHEEWKEKMWYHPKEIADFRQQAKYDLASSAALAAQGDGRIPSNSSSASTTICYNQDDSTTTTTRGLEGCAKERIRYRCLAVKAVVSGSKRHNSHANTVAMIALKCSAWNKQMAFHQACHDYGSVYDNPGLLKMIPDLFQLPPAFPFLSKRSNKRSPPPAESTTTEEGSRQVRQRIN